MANGITQQVFEQLTSAPQFENPAALAGCVAASTGLIALQLGIHRGSKEALAVKSPNPALLEAAIINPETKRPVKQSTFRRIGSTALIVMGLGIAGGSTLANPTYETTSPNNQANTAVIVDSSLSMLHTGDMDTQKTTRFTSAESALQSSNYRGNMSVVQFGDGDHVTIPLSKTWKSQLNRLNQQQVNPNGGDLVHALETTASLFPDNSKKQSQNAGNTIVVVSDGTIENTADELTAEAKKLAAQKINVEVVVAGNENTTYKIDGSKPVQSGVQPEIFKGFGEQNVIQATNNNQVIKAVDSKLKAAGSSKENQSWRVLMGAGLALAAVGLVKDYLQRARKIV